MRNVERSYFKPLYISFIATYPPRQCGIATFTHDLASTVARLQGEEIGHGDRVQIVALNNIPQGYPYGEEVRFEIQAQKRMDYRKAADFLNYSEIDVVSLQHEFGIFGGEKVEGEHILGEYVLSLLSNLKKPVVTTLHTVLGEPSPGQKEVLQAVCGYSTLVEAQSRKAVELLEEVYDVPKEKVVMIYHGAPDVPFLDPAYYKDQFHAEGRKVVLTFGLLSPNKGIEVAIEAMAQVVEEVPDVLYIILGATHPEVRRKYGESYRISLERMVEELGLEEHVAFYNRFVTSDELIRALVSADVYITPYLSKEQIVSGTLTYAVACGKAIISTPYWHAEELLGDDRGRLVPFGDSEALAEELIRLLEDEEERLKLRKRAYQFGRKMVWREVAGTYIEVFRRAFEEYGTLRPRARRSMARRPSLLEVDLRHLKTLTDDTGVLQHSIFSIPDRYHGYTTDDNARAAIVAVTHWRLFKEEEVVPLLKIYLSFLRYALDEETGRMHNFLSFDRRWSDEEGSEDCHGRSIWALGSVVAHPPDEAILGFATSLFNMALPACEGFKYPRGWAYSVLGILSYLRRFGGDRDAKETCIGLAERLLDMFKRNSSEGWPWCEEVLTYANARLPQALIGVGRTFGIEGMLEQGLRSLKWLLELQTAEGGHISVIGNKGWFPKGGEKARFDQQPIELAGLADACYEAYLATGERRWLGEIARCFDWFLGRNDLHEALYDFRTGGCKDGLRPAGANQNQGAESTLSWLMVLLRMHEIAKEEDVYRGMEGIV
ncbi:MAG: glycosyl transferase family 1 [Candidatus Latescibacterota bacterium]|nr:MAG: glycosyl transferase family 1 [Candidatus Latescibacterota bacterium]